MAVTVMQRSAQIKEKQGFLQLDDIGGQHDPHLRIVGGHHETLEGRNFQMLQNEG